MTRIYRVVVRCRKCGAEAEYIEQQADGSVKYTHYCEARS